MAKTFPFPAIVNQRAMKRALVLPAVSPDIGGVLIRGERGTAKSIAVRALAEVLPDIEVVADCPFDCSPNNPDRMCETCRNKHDAGDPLPVEVRQTTVVDLPLNASEDRVVGTIDLERAVAEGDREFEPGILAEANRNILYVDEVNLLDDHIVDVLLDAAAMNENIVEREGVSVRHPAEFILVGTMNPEEGDLRPQLLDRFDLVVDIATSEDVGERLRVADRREQFDADPEAFHSEYAEAQRDLRERIVAARERLSNVTIDEEVLTNISYEAVRRRAHGLRADIAVNRIARAIAALEDDDEVTEVHVQEAQYFAFSHRVEGVPEMDFGEGVLGDDQEGDAEGEDDDEETDSDQDTDTGAGGLPIAADGDSYPVDRTAIQPPKDRIMRERLARRIPSKVDVRSGRYVRDRNLETVDDVAIDATLRAAAPHQQARREREDPDRGIAIEARDLHQKIRERTAEALVVFIVDASGSVMSGRQMRETKRGILSLIEDAYRTRDRIAVVVFRGETAFTLVEPTRNHRRARRTVSNLTVGGNTPLAHGLVEAYELIERERRRDEDLYPLAVLFSDGQSNIEYREDGDAKEDAFEAAALFADADIFSMFLDTGFEIDTTPDEIWTDRKAERIKRKRLERNLDYAEIMNADYLPLIELPRNTVLPDEVEAPV